MDHTRQRTERAARTLARRPEADAPPPHLLLELQRRAGNQAVARAVLARKKFADAEEAKTWLAARMKNNARKKDEADADYLERLISRDPYGNPQAHKTANLTLLASALAALTGEAAEKPSGPSRKRTVPPDVMDHIVNGQLRADNSPTGLHTTQGKDKDRLCEWYGNAVQHEFDCYWKNVRSKKDKSKSKLKGSTFYPDDWDVKDIKDAIEYASQRKGKPEFEVQAPAKQPGLVLFFNGDSYYPYFDED